MALMHGYEAFCGVRIVTCCVMSNHFHILVKVPRRPDAALFPTDETLVNLSRRYYRENQCKGPAYLPERL